LKNKWYFIDKNRIKIYIFYILIKILGGILHVKKQI
jgi:hypothetical protein